MMSAMGRRQYRSALDVETLEGRQLLSVYTGPSTIRPVVTPGAIYQVTVTGGGFEKVHQVKAGVYSIDLFGTTAASTLGVSLLRARPHFPLVPLKIGEVTIKSGELGSIQAPGTADLVGTVTPITGSVHSIVLNALDTNARIDIAGSLGGGNIGSVDLGPNGHFNIGADLTKPGNLTGPLNFGSLLLDGGKLAVGNDATGAITAGSITLQRGGTMSIGRDLTGGLNVSGDLTLDSGGHLTVGRDAQNVVVNGNVVIRPTGGAISVGNYLTNLTVNGSFQGKGSSAVDLKVGLNLANLVVLGGGANQGGLQGVNFDVGKNIIGVDVRHGIFNSFITAGVLIDGGPTAAVGNIGPDGADAVFNSDIRAGVQINNFLINGNVKSDWVTNRHPTGYRTRIVAGEDRSGNFSSGGNIDHFQITGALIDSVLAASVAPYGGNGQLPDLSYGAPPPAVGKPPGDFGNNTYDAPFGVIVGGTVGNQIPFQNYTELSYFNEKLTGVTWNTTADPTIDDTILPGAINLSFASPPVDATAAQNPTTILPLPTKSTVLGGVISTPHGDNADFAGIFAANTSGVFVGSLPS